MDGVMKRSLKGSTFITRERREYLCNMRFLYDKVRLYYFSFINYVFSGGSSLRHYLEKVARHHGLEYTVIEYEKAECEVQ